MCARPRARGWLRNCIKCPLPRRYIPAEGSAATSVQTTRPPATDMYAKLIIVCCAVAAAAAAPGLLDYGYSAPISHSVVSAPVAVAAPVYKTYAAPVVKAVAPVVHAEPIDPNPAYSYAYGVQDPHTGDHKDAQETLQNGVVHGSYSLVEPDGHLRKVTYTADKVNGFNAVVERTGGTHAAPVAIAAPAHVVAAPAPIAVAAHAPISFGHGWH
ncbi:cuticle protein 21-like [Bicyclus anynana]|uniref:Cuticle protein 21-like n=1 Tax=Bicyclus anynana TaxID=110368 RepID=A0A6J1NFI4_BICAN|nr:cuticle protein 21-like [Bicyclus anynana]